MDFAAKPIRKTIETYWMHELQFFHMVLNTLAAKFSSLPGKHSRAN